MEAIDAEKVGENKVNVWVGEEHMGTYTPTIGYEVDYDDAYEWAHHHTSASPTYYDLMATCIMDAIA